MCHVSHVTRHVSYVYPLSLAAPAPAAHLAALAARWPSLIKMLTLVDKMILSWQGESAAAILKGGVINFETFTIYVS